MTEPFITYPWPADPVQTSAQDEATIARIEEQHLADAADHFPDATKMVTEYPLHVCAMFANADARLASDRIARLLDNPATRHQVKQDLIDLKESVSALETILQRMAHIHTTEG